MWIIDNLFVTIIHFCTIYLTILCTQSLWHLGTLINKDIWSELSFECGRPFSVPGLFRIYEMCNAAEKVIINGHTLLFIFPFTRCLCAHGGCACMKGFTSRKNPRETQAQSLGRYNAVLKGTGRHSWNFRYVNRSNSSNVLSHSHHINKTQSVWNHQASRGSCTETTLYPWTFKLVDEPCDH